MANHNQYTFYLNADITQFTSSMNSAQQKLISVQQTANKGLKITVDKSNVEELKAVVNNVTQSLLEEANAAKTVTEYTNKYTQATKTQAEFMGQYNLKLEQTAAATKKVKKGAKEVENAFLDSVRKVSADGDLVKVIEKWDKSISKAQ